MSDATHEPPRRLSGAWADFARVLVLASAVVAGLGIVRLARQFPGAGSSPGLLSPFLLPVGTLALETGGLVALSAALLRALERSRAPRLSRSRRAVVTLPLLALLALVLSVAESIPRGTEHPGAFANELVRSARAACGDSSAEVQVPLLGLTVSCGAASRIHGPMPGVRAVSVAMRELTFADDLRGIDIRGLELTANRALRVHLVAERARIVGLSPWSRSPRLSSFQRFATLASLGALLWLVANVSWPTTPEPSSDKITAPATPDVPPRARARRAARKWLVTMAFAIPGAASAGLFILLDQERVAPMVYASVALPALAALGLLVLAVRRLPKFFSSFDGF